MFGSLKRKILRRLVLFDHDLRQTKTMVALVSAENRVIRNQLHSIKSLLNEIKRGNTEMGNEFDEKFANIDASIGALASKLINLGSGITDELQQLAQSQSALQQKAQEVADAVASGAADKARVAELTAELTALTTDASNATSRLDGLASRITEIGSTVDSLDSQLLADDPAPTIPDLPPASSDVASVEDATDTGNTTTATSEPESGSSENSQSSTTDPDSEEVGVRQRI